MSSSGYFQDEVVAFPGGGIDFATQITKYQTFTRITLCFATGDSVKLPLDAPTGTVFWILNNGDEVCGVYPGNDESKIDDAGAGLPSGLASGMRVKIIVG